MLNHLLAGLNIFNLSNIKRVWSNIERSSKVLYCSVILVCLIFYILLGDTLYNWSTLQSMGFQIGEFMFLALAMGLVVLTGGIDLSV
ncbi:ABC transporter permease, partial [Gardnerella vaginalis]